MSDACANSILFVPKRVRNCSLLFLESPLSSEDTAITFIINIVPVNSGFQTHLNHENQRGDRDSAAEVIGGQELGSGSRGSLLTMEALRG